MSTDQTNKNQRKLRPNQNKCFSEYNLHIIETLKNAKIWCCLKIQQQDAIISIAYVLCNNIYNI